MRINFSRSGIFRPGIVDSFANKTNSKLNAVDAGENSAYLRYEGNIIKLDVSSGNSNDKFTYVIHGTEAGQEISTEGTDVEEFSGGIVKSINGKNYDIGTTIQAEVTNTGTGEVFWSNSITIKKSVENPSA